MVLPSLKSIKTLFGSPHRRTANHASRKHKDKKLCRSVDGSDGSSKNSSGQIHPAIEDFSEKMVVSKADEPQPADSVSELWLKNVPSVGRGGRVPSTKDSPAKARIAPFNSASDENWTCENVSPSVNVDDWSTKEMTEPSLAELEKGTSQTASAVQLEQEKTDVVKELLENKVINLLTGRQNDEREDFCNLKLMEQLDAERGLRHEAEKRLREMSCENEISKERLSKLQLDFIRLEEMLYSLLQYKARLDWLQKEKASQTLNYEMKLCKYQNYVANLEKENLMLLAEVKTLEATSKRSDDRERSLSRVLLERLRYLEKENSSLVLETEHQRVQYDRCLDDVANQVVQALLTQKSLREECIKLQKRVSDLEHHNRSLSLMFQRHVQMSSESNCQKGKLSPRAATMYSSNQSSMATQTTSQSEDSLESLASLCSEYSCNSGGGGGGQSGNMVIGIPGLPQLSSPPLWIRNCIDNRGWPSSFTNVKSGLAAGVQPYLGNLSPSALDDDINVTRSSFLDDAIWPGISTWDDLMVTEESGCNNLVLGENVQRRSNPLVFGMGSYQMPPLLKQVNLAPNSENSADNTNSTTEKRKKLVCDKKSTLINQLRVKSNSPNSSPPSTLSLPPTDFGLEEISRSRETKAIDRPRSFNFASKKLLGQSTEFTNGSSLPREFKFSVIKCETTTATSALHLSPPTSSSSSLSSLHLSLSCSAAADNVQTSSSESCQFNPADVDGSSNDQDNGVRNEKSSSRFGDGMTKDDGYSTMSSDVLSIEPILNSRINICQEELQEEVDEELNAEIFAADLDHSLILVEKEAETNQKEKVEVVVEEKSKCEEEEIRNEKMEQSSFLLDESYEEESANNFSFAFDADLRIMEDNHCDEFYIPIRCSILSENNKTSISFIRSASDSQLFSRSSRSVFAFEELFCCASETSLDLNSAKKVDPTTSVLQRSKRKNCLIDSAEQSEDEMIEVRNGEKKDCSLQTMKISSFWMNEACEDYSGQEKCQNFSDEDSSQQEGFEGGGSCTAVECEENLDESVLESQIENENCFDEYECCSPQRNYKEDGEMNVCSESKSVGTDFCADFYKICQVDCNSLRIKDLDGEVKAEIEEKQQESDDSSADEKDEGNSKVDECVIQETATMREKLQELGALIEESNGGEDDDGDEEDEDGNIRILSEGQEESLGKEGCTTSWIHVEAAMDLTDPKTRANILDTMMGSSSSNSSSECGDEAPDYQHLHQLHRHRRHRKATERENCILRYIPPPRPSIIGRRDFFFRYGEQEQEAVASFDFLEDMSTSISDFGSAETLNVEEEERRVAEEEEEEEEERKQFSCAANKRGWEGEEESGSSNVLQCQGDEDESVEKLSLSDSCAESFSSSNQSLNTLEE